MYRAVHVPRHFLRELLAYAEGHGPDERLFPWCRQTAWRRIKAVMETAGIEGPQATPKGFRHQWVATPWAAAYRNRWWAACSATPRAANPPASIPSSWTPKNVSSWHGCGKGPKLSWINSAR